MTTIQGMVRKGSGTASRNLDTQLPLIAREFPEIVECHRGTINLELDNPVVVVSPDHRTNRIDWDPHHAPGEVFDLVRVCLEAPLGAAAVPGWLYVAHHSDHRRNLRMHEVIAEKVSVTEGTRCAIHLNRECVTLPYRNFPVVVII